MKRIHQRNKRDSAAGFTLVELLISLLILTVVTGIIFRRIAMIVQRSQAEATKIDLTSESREFLDTFVRDIHTVGYPKGVMYNTEILPTPAIDSPLVSAGIVEATPVSITFEGDVNGEGTVYSVWYYYVDSDPNDPNCPCIRRDAAQKQPPGGPVLSPAPLYQQRTNKVTEVQYVLQPGTGAGQSGEDLFTYFDATGKQVFPTGTCAVVSDPPAPANACSDITTQTGRDFLDSIRTIKVNLTVRSKGLQVDPANKQPLVVSMTATGKVNNGCLNNPGNTANGCATSGL